jgi:hypothetical protein
VLLSIAVVALYSWPASGLRTFTRPAEVATAIPIAAVAMTMAVWHRGRYPKHPAEQPRRWLLAWGALLVVLIVWELYELMGTPRYDYPTLSSIVDGMFRRSRLFHAAMFAGWLGLGWRFVHPVRHPERATESIPEHIPEPLPERQTASS